MKTGGLKDSVKEYDSNINQGSGLLFDQHNTESFEKVINRAINLYKKISVYK